MRWSYKILKIKGIEIQVHLTFVLILIWAAYRWSISTGEGIQGAVFGIFAILLLFVSVLLHELGHSLQAVRYGIHVHNITLTPMGGLAKLDEIPEDSSKELRISIMGPLVNFGIAALLIGLGALLDYRTILSLEEIYTTLGSVTWSGLLAFLASANLMLGVFNLIPAFPMDGGRVLRALLAKRMDYPRATQIATQIGQGFAVLMGLYGLMSSNWTLFFIAIFIWMGAGQENQGSKAKTILGEVTVGQAMIQTPYSIVMNDTLSKVVELTLSTSQSDFPVLEWGTSTVIGFITQPELLMGLKKLGPEAYVRDVILAEFPSTRPEELLSHAQKKMLKSHRKALPVLNTKDELIGLLRVEDITEAYHIMSVHKLSVADVYQY